MEAIRLPDHYREIYIRDMLPGSVVFVNTSALWCESDNALYVQTDYPLRDDSIKPNRYAPPIALMKVVGFMGGRAVEGFVADLRRFSRDFLYQGSFTPDGIAPIVAALIRDGLGGETTIGDESYMDALASLRESVTDIETKGHTYEEDEEESLPSSEVAQPPLWDDLTQNGTPIHYEPTVEAQTQMASQNE